MARTRPTLLDLGVAIFSGMAVAYALCRSDASAALPGVAIAAALVPPIASAGITLADQRWTEGFRALLLFTTNLVAISSSSAVIFLILGFRPSPTSKESKTVRLRSARIALSLLVVVTIFLALSTFSLAREEAAQNEIQNVLETQATTILEADLFEYTDETLDSGGLKLTVTIRASKDIPHEKVVEYQEKVAELLQREVALTLVVIPITELDPIIPADFYTHPDADRYRKRLARHRPLHQRLPLHQRQRIRQPQPLPIRQRRHLHFYQPIPLPRLQHQRLRRERPLSTIPMV